MWNTIARNVLILFTFTLGLFFVLIYFFRNESLYQNSMKINSFVIPIFYTAVAFYSTYKQLEKGNYSLKKGFFISALSLFIAGFLSHGVVFFYLSKIDFDTELILRTQWIALNRKHAIESNPENIKQILTALDSPEMRNTSVVCASNIFKFMSLQSLFYLFISFFVSFFIRSRA